jgi:hypothetical protein
MDNAEPFPFSFVWSLFDRDPRDGTAPHHLRRPGDGLNNHSNRLHQVSFDCPGANREKIVEGRTSARRR